MGSGIVAKGTGRKGQAKRRARRPAEVAEELRRMVPRRTWGFAGKGGLQLRAQRHDGWTDARKQQFLDLYSECGNMRLSAEAVGMSTNSVGRLRQRDAAFQADFERAKAIAYEAIEEGLMERARHGTKKGIWYKDQRVGEEIVYNDGMALKLLAMHRKAVADYRAAAGEEQDVERSLQIFLAKLEEIEVRKFTEEEKRARLAAARDGGAVGAEKPADPGLSGGPGAGSADDSPEGLGADGGPGVPEGPESDGGHARPEGPEGGG
jgi:hypothetical protein